MTKMQIISVRVGNNKRLTKRMNNSTFGLFLFQKNTVKLCISDFGNYWTFGGVEGTKRFIYIFTAIRRSYEWLGSDSENSSGISPKRDRSGRIHVKDEIGIGGKFDNLPWRNHFVTWEIGVNIDGILMNLLQCTCWEETFGCTVDFGHVVSF